MFTILTSLPISWTTSNKLLTNSLNNLIGSAISPSKTQIVHYRWGGNVTAGECVRLGYIDSAIPANHILLGVILTPRASVHISMSWRPETNGIAIYAYSENHTTAFYYDALLILAY